MPIDPTQQQVERLVAASSEDATPVDMLNLLRFAADGGQESYATYAAAVLPHIARVNGELVWSGSCTPAVIGPEDDEWDVAFVVRYPSRAKFLEMVTDPGYLEIAKHRSGGLADSRLIPCGPASLA